MIRTWTLIASCLSFLFSATSCSSNSVQKTCACVRQATNQAVQEGNQLTEDDLVALCVEDREVLKKLPLDQKNIIAKCVDSALTLSASKDFFPTENQKDFSEIQGFKEIEGVINKHAARYNGTQAVLEKSFYFLAKRPMAGQLLVDQISSVENDKIEVYGELFENGKVNKKIQIRLLLPWDAHGKIKVYNTVDNDYEQVVKFEGRCTNMGTTVSGQYSITFTVNKYELVNKSDHLSKQTTQAEAKTTQTEQVNQDQKGTKTVLVEKAYFFKETDLSTKRKGYLIKGQIVTTGERSGDFVYCKYIGDKSTTEGWMLASELSK